MLTDATENPDISSFKDTETFKQCQALGIIPGKDPEPINNQSDFSEKRPECSENIENDHLLQLRLSVEGMWCPACAWIIEHTLLKQKGVLKASCNFSTDRVILSYDPVKTSPPQISKAINNLGYTLSVSDDISASKERRKEFIRFFISAFLTMNVMMLSFSLYSGFFMELSSISIRYISWPIFVMATVVLFYGGRKIHVKGWAAWQSFGFGMETLISMGSLCTYFFSIYNFWSNSIHLYFDTTCMLITLVLLGKTLENRAKERVTKDLESFFSLVPKKVRIPSPSFPDGKYVSAKQLREGDCFILEENEIAPADALIIDGRVIMDESTVTGESIPKNKNPGERITSGTRVISGKITARAEVIGENSILGQMILIMEKALGQKTPLEGKADIAMRWFVPVILFLSVGTGLVGISFGLSLEHALVRAVTVMVISCPCALGIAIPLARVAGISLAARNGILVHEFSAFESASNINSFVFDKTGTLTIGNWRLLKIESMLPWTEDEIISIAAGMEKDSGHHVGMVISQYARKKKIVPAAITAVSFHDSGISGIIENKSVKIGSASFCSISLQTGFNLIKKNQAHNLDIFSAVHLTLDDKEIGRITLGDQIKIGAEETVRKLHQKNYQTYLVSGDGTNVTVKVAKKLGIKNARGEMTPAQKSDFIRKLKTKGRIVAMAGDGINDAPALARADLAIAVPSGNLLGKEATHLTLMRGEPLQIIDFLTLTKKVNRKIYQNLIFSFIYNAISIPVAMAGFLSPLVAVCAMLLSSLSVTGNTLLLTKAN
jgi:P-type Cu+ transporter